MVDYLEENVDDFIDLLRQQNGIKLSDTFDFAEAHYDELQKMDNIFKFETDEDKGRCMTLARILTPEWADDIIAYSRKETFNRTGLKLVDEPEKSKYTTEIITALIYNPQFMKKAWDWCVITYHEVLEKTKNNPVITAFSNRRIISNNLFIRKQAATNSGIREILKDVIIWNNRQCDVFGYLFQNGEITFELHIKDTKDLENITNLKLSITIINDNISIREEPLKFWNDSWNPGETAVYSTGNINIADYDRIVVNEIIGNNDA